MKPALRFGWLGVLLLVACGAGSDAKKSPPTMAQGGAGPIGPSPSSPCGQSQLGAPRLRRLSRDEILSTLNGVFPEAKDKWKSTLSADTIAHSGFDNDATLLAVGNQTAAELDATADALATVIAGELLPTLLPCAASSEDAACARQFVDNFGKRLFHRAVSADESARYLALFTQVLAAKDFPTAIRYVTRALVQSPHAVYRREIGELQAGVYRLTPAEIATELAYDYTGTAPSEELLAQAAAGQLASPAALESKAHELLSSPPGLATIDKFVGSWLGYARTSGIVKPNVEQFASLRDEMVAETRRFVAEVVVAQNGGLKELLTAPFTTPSVGLASFYGFPAPAAPYAITPRPAGRGVGILAQGSLLSALAGPDASSPTKRGLLVMDRLLCRQRPQVPASVPPFGEPQPGKLTTRQRYETLHVTAPSCKGCHASFDPIGFGFEHYDEAGRYRELDGGLPVDSKSFVPAADGGGHAFELANLEELAQGLAQLPEAYACVSGYASTYVNGVEQGCLGETKRADFIEQNLGFVDYLASLAAEPHFVQRRAP